MVHISLYLALIVAFSQSASAVPLQNRDQPQNSTQHDPCAALNGNSSIIHKPSDVVACFRTIPFNTTHRDQVLNATRMMNSINVFEFNHIYDPNPVENQGVDTGAELNRIGNTTYPSDWHFQQDLSSLFHSLNDAHYYWSGCYKTFENRHPFPVVGLKDGIYLPSDLANLAGSLKPHYEDLGFNFTQLAGALVQRIDGLDALDYLLQKVVPVSGAYQDPQQRLNSVVSSVTGEAGRLMHRVGDFAAPTIAPEADTFTMAVETVGGERLELEIPWATRWPAGILNVMSAADYHMQHCLEASPDGPLDPQFDDDTKEEAEARETLELFTRMVSSGNYTTAELAQIAYQRCPNPQEDNPTGALPDSLQGSAEYLGGRDVTFYDLGNSTGVMMITTFAPDPVANQFCYQRFALDSYLGLRNLTERGITHLVIDTSNNGGGYIHLSQLLQHLVTGHAFSSERSFPIILRQSEVTNALVESYATNSTTSQEGQFDPEQYQYKPTQNGSSIGPTTNYLLPGTSMQINNHTMYTSEYLYQRTTEIDAFIKQFNATDAPGWPADKIVITGNGLCGSACSGFTNFLLEYYNGTALISTPQPGKPVEFQAFGVGSVIKIGTLAAELVMRKRADLVPKVDVKMDMMVAFRASISTVLSPGTFLQYRGYPAPKTYAQTMEQYMDPIGTWRWVAKQTWG